MTMFDTIKAHLATAVPYAGLTGVELVELSPGRAVTRLAKRFEVGNHLGTMHAGALFTLGEAASGGAMTGIFAERILGVRPVAAEARITYTKAARGTVTATATTSEAPDELKARLEAEGKVKFDVTVDIADEQGEMVAGMTVAWHVRKS